MPIVIVNISSASVASSLEEPYALAEAQLSPVSMCWARLASPGIPDASRIRGARAATCSKATGAAVASSPAASCSKSTGEAVASSRL